VKGGGGAIRRDYDLYRRGPPRTMEKECKKMVKRGSLKGESKKKGGTWHCTCVGPVKSFWERWKRPKEEKEKNTSKKGHAGGEKEKYLEEKKGGEGFK